MKDFESFSKGGGQGIPEDAADAVQQLARAFEGKGRGRSPARHL